MTIIGIGNDLCDIRRIEKSLERFGDRFVQRVFTKTEQAKASSRPYTRAGTLAKRFAAKEAFSKAVGTGFKRGVFMKDIGVVNLPSGQPTLELTGGAGVAGGTGVGALVSCSRATGGATMSLCASSGTAAASLRSGSVKIGAPRAGLR